MAARIDWKMAGEKKKFVDGVRKIDQNGILYISEKNLLEAKAFEPVTIPSLTWTNIPEPAT